MWTASRTTSSICIRFWLQLTNQPSCLIRRETYLIWNHHQFFLDLDPNYTGLLFPDISLEKPDLTSLMDIAPQDTKGRVLHTMKEVHARNMERVQLLDHVVREVYSIRAGLVNDRIEVIRRYGKLATTLNVWQQ